METSSEKPQDITELAVERIAKLNRALFGEKVVIIDATGTVPHKIEPPTTAETSAA